MEQRIYTSKQRQVGDVELTLVSTGIGDFQVGTALREPLSAPTFEKPSPLQVEPGPRAKASVGYLLTKRVIDIVVSLSVLSVGFLALFLLAVSIRIESAGPSIHRRRVLSQQTWDDSMGEGALQTFDAYKLRTMIPNADEYLKSNPQLLQAFEKDWKLENDPRITRLGVWLRACSIDEFPQLLNVLSGQMSLVGPRMITPPELARYGADASRLLSVKPGLTGLWQVSGRQELSYDERVRLDMAYIETRSILLDFQILLKTVTCVLQRKGAY